MRSPTDKKVRFQLKPFRTTGQGLRVHPNVTPLATLPSGMAPPDGCFVIVEIFSWVAWWGLRDIPAAKLCVFRCGPSLPAESDVQNTALRCLYISKDPFALRLEHRLWRHSGCILPWVLQRQIMFQVRPGTPLPSRKTWPDGGIMGRKNLASSRRNRSC